MSKISYRDDGRQERFANSAANYYEYTAGCKAKIYRTKRYARQTNGKTPQSIMLVILSLPVARKELPLLFLFRFLNSVPSVCLSVHVKMKE